MVFQERTSVEGNQQKNSRKPYGRQMAKAFIGSSDKGT